MPKNNKFQTIIKAMVYLMAFLVPTFFLPISLEPFEFNKMYLLTGLVSACLLLWGIQVATTKELKIAKTRILIPGLLLVTSVFISTLFSIDKISSIFGASGRWYPSLVSFLTLGALYIIITTHLNEKGDLKKALISLSAGTTVSSIIALLSYFGVLFIKDTDNNFNPTGSLLTLGILAVLTTIFGFYTLLKDTNSVMKIVAIISFIPNFFYIVLYDNSKVWILLILGIILIGTISTTAELKLNRLYMLLMGILTTAMLGLTLVPITKVIIMKHTYPEEVQLPFKESWDVVVSTMRDFPIAGTGPSTFYLNYPRYKSVSMNQNENWNIRFDKPQSEALLVISSLGILGILSASYFVIEVLKVTAKAYRGTDSGKLVGIMVILTLLTMFLTHETVPVGFAATLFLGLLGSIEVSQTQKFLNFSSMKNAGVNTLTTVTTSENEVFLTTVIALPLIVLACLGLITIYKVYPSEYYMKKALQALNTDAGKSYEYQTKAIKLNPHRSNYYNTFSQTNLAIAINLSNQGDLSEADAQTMQNLIATAISSSKIATDSVNPLDPVNWEVQASIYRTIKGAAKDADQWAIKALNAANQLDPTNPRLRLELGGIYYASEDYNTAASFFRQSINLKPDYANAYYNLAQAAKNLGDYATAKRALDLTLSLVERTSTDADKVRQELIEMEEKLASSGGTEQKPTVEELANQGDIANQEETETPQEQEPLAVEGEKQEFVEPLNDPENGENTENNGVLNAEMGNEESVDADLE